jgi:hypothetical protein
MSSQRAGRRRRLLVALLVAPLAGGALAQEGEWVY